MARGGGALPWRGPLWDPGTEATLPPLLLPQGQAAACWEGSPFLMNKLLSLLTARTGLWGIKGARAWETATNLMKRMDSRCGLWPSRQLPSLDSWMGWRMKWGCGWQEGVRLCRTVALLFGHEDALPEKVRDPCLLVSVHLATAL